jgi:hypothetical protein
MLRDYEREVLKSIHVNKKEYKENTCKQERVLKGILTRKAERKGEYEHARKSVKENTFKQETVLREILEAMKSFKVNTCAQKKRVKDNSSKQDSVSNCTCKQDRVQEKNLHARKSQW